jgi:cytochrome b
VRYDNSQICGDSFDNPPVNNFSNTRGNHKETAMSKVHSLPSNGAVASLAVHTADVMAAENVT